MSTQHTYFPGCPILVPWRSWSWNESYVGQQKEGGYPLMFNFNSIFLHWWCFIFARLDSWVSSQHLGQSSERLSLLLLNWLGTKFYMLTCRVFVCMYFGVYLNWNTTHVLRHVPWRMEKASLSAWLRFMGLAMLLLASVRALSQLPDNLQSCGGLAVAFRTWTCAVCAAFAAD